MKSNLFYLAFFGVVAAVYAADNLKEETEEATAEPSALWSDFEQEESRRGLQLSARPKCSAGCVTAKSYIDACQTCVTPSNCKQKNRKSGVTYCHDGCLYHRSGFSHRLWLRGDPLGCPPQCEVKECEGYPSPAEAASWFTAKIDKNKILLQWSTTYFDQNQLQLCFHNMHTKDCKVLQKSKGSFRDNRKMVKGKLYGYRLCELYAKYPKCRRVQITFPDS